MKKYITIAALLVAGTGVANAEQTVELVTTFTNANQTVATAVGLTVEGLDGVTATVDSLVRTDASDTTVAIKNNGSGAASSDATVFTPDTNVGSGTPWTAEFTYTLGGNVEVTALNGVTLDVVLFDSSGRYQTDRASWTGGVTFTATILSGVNVLGTFDSTLTPEHGQDSVPFELSLTPSTVIDLSTVDTYTVKLVLTETLSAGCFVGLKDIKQSLTVVPEPSAFGLIAGLSALAVVASRRRRK